MAKRRKPADADLSYIASDLRSIAVPLSELKPDPNNANHHSDASITGIVASLKEFGQMKPIVVNAASGVIIAGNGTLEAAKKLGWSHLAAVRETLTAAQHRAYGVADNRSAQLAEWDQTELEVQMSLISEDYPDLYEDLQLAELIDSAPMPPGDSQGEAMPENYGVMITCCSEKEQREMVSRLQGLGIACSVMKS